MNQIHGNHILTSCLTWKINARNLEIGTRGESLKRSIGNREVHVEHEFSKDPIIASMEREALSDLAKGEICVIPKWLRDLASLKGEPKPSPE